jgi:hypothetical protein
MGIRNGLVAIFLGGAVSFGSAAAVPAWAGHSVLPPEAAKVMEEHMWLEAVADWNGKCKQLNAAELDKLEKMKAEGAKILVEKFGLSHDVTEELEEASQSLAGMSGCDNDFLPRIFRSMAAT